MAYITLKVVVNNLAEVMASFTHLKIYRSTTGVSGVFTELTTPSTRIALVTGTTVYSFTDSTGDAAYYYRSSYYHATTLAESGQSDPEQGEGDPALDVLSVDELKGNYLLGVDLTLEDGSDFPDSFYEHYIKVAVSQIEQRLDIPIRPQYIEDERHDFIREDYDKYIWLNTDVIPVIEISQVRLVLPGEVVVQTFDPNWIHVNKAQGQINIVPGAGSAGTILLGASGAWIPFIYGTNRFIPDAFRINYTAGVSAGTTPYLLKDIVGKVAAQGPLQMAGELLLGAGIANSNVGIDGLSQSVSTLASPGNGGAYIGRIKQYQEEVKDTIPELIRYYHGAAKLRVV
jgi:hypothetical protein